MELRTDWTWRWNLVSTAFQTGGQLVKGDHDVGIGFRFGNPLADFFIADPVVGALKIMNDAGSDGRALVFVEFACFRHNFFNFHGFSLMGKAGQGELNFAWGCRCWSAGAEVEEAGRRHGSPVLLFADVDEAAFFVSDDDVGFLVAVDIGGHDLAADAAGVVDDFGAV